MEKAELVAVIKKAFNETVYPKHPIIDEDAIRDNEVVECESKFKGKKWQEIDYTVIAQENYASGSAFLSREAFRYFLPAYMTAIVENYYEAIEALDSIMHRLTLPIFSVSGTEKNGLVRDVNGTLWCDFSEDWFKKTVNGLTKEQCLCIKYFFEYLSATHPEDCKAEAVLAIERYWGKFTS